MGAAELVAAPPATASDAQQQQAEPLPPHHVPPSPYLGWLPGQARFTNPWPTWSGDKRLPDLLRFAAELRAVGAPNWGWLTTNRQPTLAECSAAFPLVPPDAAALAAPPADQVQALWVGHATLLVQLEGLTLLTDPVFSQRASPVQFMGPQRAVQPALVPEDPAFPRHLDAVLISHNHYDHLDAGSVARLLARFGPQLAFYVPLGLGPWFARAGATNARELDWFESVQHPGSKVRLVLTPAQHWSSRSGLDRRATLWGGYAALGQRLRFFFAGDTGLCPAFKEIGQRLGPFDLAAIPIGAYEPRWFMAPMHTNAEDAIQIHRDVRSKRSIGIHACTFYLTTEALDEPPARLQAAAAAAGLAPREFVTLRHGAILRTADGVDGNDPPLLPFAA